jgi:RNA polymerase sigma factor for flagellar operon FliA
MVVDYLPLVRHVVGRIASGLPAHVDKDELFQVGSIGLVNASRSYDSSRGVAFKTYAYALIRGAVLDELRRLDSVPRSTREKLRALDKMTKALREKTNRTPSTLEIAAALGTEESSVRELSRIARNIETLSMDHGTQGSELFTIRDLLACPTTMDPCDRAARVELIATVADAIRELPDSERRVITLYYREGLLLREIGTVLRVTESRVSQIHSRALARLQHSLA